MFAATFFVISSPDETDRRKVYLSFPGIWSDDEADAMKFPHRVLAESYAKRFKGTVEERRAQS